MSTTISNTTKKCFRLKKPIKALLLDITGVLYESGQTSAINGSIEAIQKIRSAGLEFRLLTNETQKTTKKLLEKLINFGYDFQENEIITPAIICLKYLNLKKLQPFLLVHPNILPEFSEFEQEKKPNCVVIGDADEYFTFKSLNECFQLLMQLKQEQQDHQDGNNGHDNGNNDGNNDLLISLGKNKYYRENGKLKMDLGGFTCALEYATDLKAKIIGKPSKDYFQNALDSFDYQKNFTKDNIVMIGDDILGDVKGAQDFGIHGILVRTGKYLPINENHPDCKPDAIFDNLLMAIDQILLQNQQLLNQESI